MYKILIVDDELIEREGVAYLVKKYKYPFQIFIKSNGKEAISFLKDMMVDVLCTDIKMPFVNGLELSEAAREMNPDIKIMVLTAYNDFQFTKKAIKVKVNDYVMKPVALNEFQAGMDQILSELQERDEERSKKMNLIKQIETGKPEEKESLFEQIIAELHDQYSGESADDNISEHNAIKMVLKILRTEYASIISLDSIAKRVCFSKGYLSNLFKSQTGFSVMQYITMLRMQKARELLLTTNMKLSDICRAVGYQNDSYFCLTFKKHYGVTAIAMRNGEDNGKS